MWPKRPEGAWETMVHIGFSPPWASCAKCGKMPEYGCHHPMLLNVVTQRSIMSMQRTNEQPCYLHSFPLTNSGPHFAQLLCSQEFLGIPTLGADNHQPIAPALQPSQLSNMSVPSSAESMTDAELKALQNKWSSFKSYQPRKGLTPEEVSAKQSLLDAYGAASKDKKKGILLAWSKAGGTKANLAVVAQQILETKASHKDHGNIGMMTPGRISELACIRLEMYQGCAKAWQGALQSHIDKNQEKFKPIWPAGTIARDEGVRESCLTSMSRRVNLHPDLWMPWLQCMMWQKHQLCQTCQQQMQCLKSLQGICREASRCRTN